MLVRNQQEGFIPVIWVVVLTVALIGAVYGAYRFGVQKSPNLSRVTPDKEMNGGVTKAGEESQDASVENLKESEIGTLAQSNFSRTGYLLDREEWVLLYEEPGNPAIDVSLKFTQNSRCDLGKGALTCDTSKLENGTRVTVEGNQSGKEVTVLTLKKF